MAGFVETVLRSKDLLHVQFEFVNLELDATVAAAPVLKRQAPGDAFIVVRLPPQHIAEEAFGAAATPPPPYDARLASPSRIAFRVRDGAAPIPFTVESLLREIGELSPWTPTDAPGSTAATFIEFPDRVLLVPEAGARLSHRPGILSSDNDGASDATWTELWHTRLTSPTAKVKGGARFRAVANVTDRAERLANGILTLAHRTEIVARCGGPQPKPLVGSSSFLLTPLGATAQLKSEWPVSTVLSTWEHDTVTGRDRFVRIDEPGFLYPFGHRASRQTIVRREFSTLSESVLFAGLQKQFSIKVEETERDYAALAHAYRNGGREMPLKQVRIVSQLDGVPAEHAPVRFGVHAVDGNGHLIVCDLTMFFVTNTEASNPGALGTIHDLYVRHNAAVLRPQLLTLADDKERRGDTSLVVTKLIFKVVAPQPAGAVHPPFLPALETADASVPALDQLFGTVASGPGTAAAVSAAAPAMVRASTSPSRTLRLLDAYLANGFSSTDAKQVFARLEEAMPPLAIPADRAGGLAAPTFQSLNGLSRVRGLVADVDGFANNVPIDPARLIGDAKLLGVIELKKLIDGIVDDVPADRLEALYDEIDANPRIFATRPVLTSVQSPAGVEVRFLWRPRIRQESLPAPLKASPAGPVSLTVRGRMRKTATPAPDGAFEIDGKLQNFGLTFAELLTVQFTHVQFIAGGGRKMDVKVAIKDVAFDSKLTFINKIGELLTKNNIGGGPSIRPQADGVVASFSIGLPSFAMGILSFQNIAVGSSISLPFVDKPAAVRFTLSERGHPFLVSVSIFGGTGFFAIEVRTDKSVQIEAAIEFGGVVSINLLGIVQGGVYVFVGIFVSVDSHGTVGITGHLRFGGYVDVAGLLTISIEFYIALTYTFTDRVLLGVGRVTIGVKLLFFSLSRTFEVTRRIKGFGDPPEESVRSVAAPAPEPLPTFASTMSGLQWEQYCQAFA